MKDREYTTAASAYGGGEQTDGWELLRNAVIVVAVDDYISCLTSLLLVQPGQPFETKDCTMKKEVEEFFFSDMFHALSNLEPKRIISKCRKKAFQRVLAKINGKIAEEINASLKGY